MNTIHELFNESTLIDQRDPDYPISGDSVTIVPGTVFAVNVKVDIVPSVLLWEFNTTDYNVQFKIVKHNEGCVPEDVEMVPLLPYHVLKVHSGSLTINERGKYILVWDNSSSWFKERTLNYKVDLRRLERSNEEISLFAKKVCSGINERKIQLNRTNTDIETNCKEKNDMEHIKMDLQNQIVYIENDLQVYSKRISEEEEVLNTIQLKQKKLQGQVEYLRRMAPFIVEGERIFSMLHGVDLLRISCVNRLLHDAVYQDGVWCRVFYQDDPELLTPVLQNDRLRVMYNLMNPTSHCSKEITADRDVLQEIDVKDDCDSIVLQDEDEQKERDSSHEEQNQQSPQNQQSQVQPATEFTDNITPVKRVELIPDNSDPEITTHETVSLKDLSLLYKITEKQGWYKDKEDRCYFIRFRDSSKKTIDVLFPAISSTELDYLIRQTLKSSVLIPMPGTEAGKSGYYIDRFRRISKWDVETIESDSGHTLKWTEVQL